jgi:hypothetical protein
MNIGDAVIIPGGLNWKGRRGKLAEIRHGICVVEVNGVLIDVFSLDVKPIPKEEVRHEKEVRD